MSNTIEVVATSEDTVEVTLEENTNAVNVISEDTVEISTISEDTEAEAIEETVEVKTIDDMLKGDSAYQIAVKNGFEGTEEEWVESLNGEDGTDGISVVKVEQTTTSDEDGGTNVVTFTMSDGTTYEFTVKNGNKGTQGESASNKLSELTNDIGFITNTVDDLLNYYLKSETYTQEEVNALVSEIPKFSIQVVDALPSNNISETTVYLLTTATTGESNLYTEYIYVNGAWETLGTQKVDLTDYYNINEIDSLLLSHTHNASKIITSYHTLSSTEIAPTGGTYTVESELVKFANAIKVLNTFQTSQTSTNANVKSRLDDLENKGWLLVPYVNGVVGETVNAENTDVNWTDFKGFVIGVEGTGANGTQYCETKYLPANYVTITNAFRHVIELNWGASFTLRALVRIYATDNKVAFNLSECTGWVGTRFFLYGVK